MILQLFGVLGLSVLTGLNSVSFSTDQETNADTGSVTTTMKMGFDSYMDMIYYPTGNTDLYVTGQCFTYINSEGEVVRLENVTLASAMNNANARNMKFGIYTSATTMYSQGQRFMENLSLTICLPYHTNNGETVTFKTSMYDNISVISSLTLTGYGFNDTTVYHYSYDAGYNWTEENQIYSDYQFFVPYGTSAYQNGYVYPLTVTFRFKTGQVYPSRPALYYVQGTFTKDGNNAYSSGYNRGYDEGYDQGYSQGYQTGYTEGFTYADNQDSIALTIFTGIINIALLPINFFLACLNFEVFGINIGSFVSALLTVAIVVIILRTILNGGNKSD